MLVCRWTQAAQRPLSDRGILDDAAGRLRDGECLHTIACTSDGGSSPVCGSKVYGRKVLDRLDSRDNNVGGCTESTEREDQICSDPKDRSRFTTCTRL
jgi:hypothetical protein